MDKEQEYLIVISALLVLFIVISGLVGLVIGVIYQLIFMTILTSAGIVLFLLLYLRVQHNVERQANRSINLRGFIDCKFNEHKKIHREVVDFFDSLLRHVENMENREENSVNELVDRIQRIDDKYHNILDYQREQTASLKNDIYKLQNDKQKRRK